MKLSNTTLRPDATDLKEQENFASLAQKFGFDLQEGYNTCPFCNKHKKLAVNHKSYHCFVAGCKGEKKGDIFDFLMKTEVARDFNDAYNLVLKALGYEVDYKKIRKARSTRESILEKAFEVYNQATTTKTWDYLFSRSLSKSLWDIPIGHSGSRTLLQERGFTREELEKSGLLSSSGKELFYNHVIFPIFDSKGRLVHLQGRNLDSNPTLRWINTRSDDYSPSISHFLFNANNLSSENVFLTEGVTDGMTLIETLGKESVVSCFGTNPYLYVSHSLLNRESLTACFDNDVFLEGEQRTLKSWSSVLKPLLELKRQLNIPLYCVMPPNKPRIKDINDWWNRGNITESSLKEQRVEIFDFVLQNFPTPAFHGQLIRHIETWEDNILKEKLENQIKDSTIDYLIQLKKGGEIHYNG
jgi:DNA primase